MASDQQAHPMDTATFAGGCFWCMQPPYDKLPGVKSVVVGYTGGHVKKPSYEQVCTGQTGHVEAVQVIFDATQITYQQLLEVFWRNIDPTTLDQQFADEGSQYRTAIFYHTDEQRKLAEASKRALEVSRKFDRPIVTEITEATAFYPAEEYHQGYCYKQPTHYKAYRIGSGREGFLKKTWIDKASPSSEPA